MEGGNEAGRGPQSPGHALLDRTAMRIFPAFVMFFAAFSLVLLFVYFRDDVTFGHLIYSICGSYTIGFMALGVPSLLIDRHGSFRRYKVFLSVLLCATVAGVLLWILFGDSDENNPNMFIAGFFYLIAWTVDDVSLLTVVLGVYVLTAITTLVSYGVLEIVTAYFGKNYHRILLSLKKPGDGRLKRSAQKMFMIPDVIDVTEVTISPREGGGFDTELFGSLMRYVIAVGVVTASYLFLNPVFLQSIPLQEMMLIMILLSLFVCVLVIPCSIVRSLGAEAHSQAPRPLVLWKGMKNKMFHGGFYAALFLTLLWVCIFTGEDFVRIAISYVGYFAFMFLMSALVSFIYVNSFYPKFRDMIVYNFRNAGKK